MIIWLVYVDIIFVTIVEKLDWAIMIIAAKLEDKESVVYDFVLNRLYIYIILTIIGIN